MEDALVKARQSENPKEDAPVRVYAGRRPSPRAEDIATAPEEVKKRKKHALRPGTAESTLSGLSGLSQDSKPPSREKIGSKNSQGADGRQSEMRRRQSLDKKRAGDIFAKKTEKMSRSLEGRNKDKAMEEDRLELQFLLEDCGEGSVLRGWRRELDPDGQLEVDLITFAKVAEKLNYVGDAMLLFGVDGDLDSFTLSELSPELGGLTDRFRKWVEARFPTDAERSCHVKFFDAMIENHPTLDKEVFMDACTDLGFNEEDVCDEDIEELWHLCDYLDYGELKVDDLIFVQDDLKVREREAFKSKMKEVWEWKQEMAQEYMSKAKAKNGNSAPSVGPRHRLAPRAWSADAFESLPSVICQRRYERQRDDRRKQKEARELFVHHAKTMVGNEVRLMRLPDGLDPEGTFKITMLKLKRYFRRHPTLNMDVHALMGVLDRDGDGYINLHDLSVERSRALAYFLKWARSFCGSAAGIWDHKEVKKVKKQESKGGFVSDKKMQAKTFAQALKVLKWPGVPGYPDSEMRHLVASSLDYYDCGLVMRTDLEWIDKWTPPEFLAAEPDMEAVKEFKVLLLRVFGHLLKAWRCVLDVDDSNSVSWDEFCTACKRVRFTGNIAGAWVALDDDLSGAISMKEFDPASHELLASFKDWADMYFGSAKVCFEALDEDSSGLVSLREMKRVCKRMKWIGDVQTLFDCLDVSGGRAGSKTVSSAGACNLSLKELVFLDSWASDLEDDPALFTSSQLLNDSAALANDSAKKVLESRSLSRRSSIAAKSPSQQKSPGGSRPVSSQGVKPFAPGVLLTKNASAPALMCGCGMSSCSPTGVGHAHQISDDLVEMRKTRSSTDWKPKGMLKPIKGTGGLTRALEALAKIGLIGNKDNDLMKQSRPPKALRPLSPYIYDLARQAGKKSGSRGASRAASASKIRQKTLESVNLDEDPVQYCEDSEVPPEENAQSEANAVDEAPVQYYEEVPPEQNAQSEENAVAQ